MDPAFNDFAKNLPAIGASVQLPAPVKITTEEQWRAYETDAWVRAHRDLGLKLDHVPTAFVDVARERVDRVADYIQLFIAQIADYIPHEVYDTRVDRIFTELRPKHG